MGIWITTLITFFASSLRNGATGIYSIYTTLINYLVYTLLVEKLGFSVIVSNAIAWFIACCFAFASKKLFKFKKTKLLIILKQFVKFMLARGSNIILETVILEVTVNLCGFNELVMKVVAIILIMILNYVVNRCIVFKEDRILKEQKEAKNKKIHLKKYLKSNKNSSNDANENTKKEEEIK